MKKLLFYLLLLVPIFGYSQMSPGEEFTGQFRPNPDCQYDWEGYTNFNRWKCLVPVERPLPVTLVSFTAIPVVPGTIKIDWRYELLPKHDFFILQHSRDAQKWEKLSSQKESTYLHRTKDVNNYYRLLSVDTDGSVNVYKSIHAKTQIITGRYYDIYGRLVKNPVPYQLVIQDGIKKIFVK